LESRRRARFGLGENSQSLDGKIDHRDGWDYFQCSLPLLTFPEILTLSKILLPRPRLSLASGQVGMLGILEIFAKTNAPAF
jgi:hypothetical protein